MKKRRMKIERKLMAFLLALVMVMGMMPVMSLTVKADGTVEEAEISEWPTSSIAGTVEVTTDNGVTTVKLLKCIKTMNTLTLNSGNCVLDLNGFGIRYASNNTSNGVIMVSNGATLTLSDSNASQQNPNCYFITLDNNSRGISVSNSGTATDTCIEVTGGYITGGIGHSDQWRTRGGGINILENSAVNMTGGTIIGNTAPGQGGGVQIWGGTFTMNDGAKIIRNTAGQGAGVTITRNGTFNMSGGLIENNTAANRGGGVFVHCSNSYHDNKFNVSGTAVIKDNWVGSGENASANNVYLNADSGFGAKITINGELGNNVPIGMTMAVPGVFTNSTTADYNDISKFTSENEGYMLGKDPQGQLLLGVPVTVTFNDNGHGTAPVSQTVASGSVITKPTNPTAEGYVFCGWYKEESLSNEWDFDTDVVSGDITLYAKWNKSYTVTFKVANGAWDDGEGDAATADKTVVLTGSESDVLKLATDQIPAVGNKPNSGYEAGNWDVAPDTETEITANTVYTYTFASSAPSGDDDGGNTPTPGGDDDGGNTPGGDTPAPSDSGEGGSDTPASDPVTPSGDEGTNGSQGTEGNTGYVKDVTGTDEAAGNYSLSQKIINNGDLKTLLSLSDSEVNEGTKVWLDVADLGNNAPDSDKALVEAAKGDYTIGTYLDINLYKKVGNNEAVKVTKTNGNVEVSLVMPENLRAEGRTFGVVRIHDDMAALLSASYARDSYALTFETDGFSTYAIVYKDGTSTGGNTSSNTSTSTDNSSSGSNNTTTTTSTVVPKTDGMSGIMVWSLMLILSLSTLGVVAFMRVKENK